MIKLIKPTFEQLGYTKYLWSDELTMRDVGGIRTKLENEWKDWYLKMVEPTDCCNKYFQIYNDNIPVGEISFHRYDKETKTANLNIKIEYKYRRMGYASEALHIFKDFFFKEFGGDVLQDNVSSASGIVFMKKRNFNLVETEGDCHLFKITKG